MLRKAAYNRGRRAWLLIATGLLIFAGCSKKEEAPHPGDTGTAQQAAPTPAGKTRITAVLPEGQPRPNVIFILVDALRADRLAAYGCRKALTPTMDSLAAVSVVFDNCIATAPWTLPSVATIFTSYYPRVHKAVSYRVVAGMEEGRRAKQAVLSDEFLTLAEAFKQAGYETAGFCANKFIRAPYGFAQGFDHFDTDFADNTVRGSVVNAAAIKWLKSRKSTDKPLFLYLHYMDVHGPYDASPRFMDPLMKKVEEMPDKHLLTPQEFRRINAYLRKPPKETSDPTRFERLKGYREYWEARYDAGVAEADFYLGQMFKALSSMGLLEDSLVVLLADHGEALCEHGVWDHGYSQYQTDLHVPLIIHWKNVLPPGRVRRLASLVDVMPTLLEMVRIPLDEKVQGQSLVPHINGTLPKQPLVRFAEAIKGDPARQFAVVVDNTKLILTRVPGQRLPNGSVAKPSLRRELYNLATDPMERFDIAEQNPGQVKGMTKLLQAFVASCRDIKPGVKVEHKAVEPTVMKKLQQIGYIGGAEEEEEEDEPAPTDQPPQTAPSATQPTDNG